MKYANSSKSAPRWYGRGLFGSTPEKKRRKKYCPWLRKIAEKMVQSKQHAHYTYVDETT
jgi:hypothetical protein